MEHTQCITSALFSHHCFTVCYHFDWPHTPTHTHTPPSIYYTQSVRLDKYNRRETGSGSTSWSLARLKDVSPWALYSSCCLYDMLCYASPIRTCVLCYGLLCCGCFGWGRYQFADEGLELEGLLLRCGALHHQQDLSVQSLVQWRHHAHGGGEALHTLRAHKHTHTHYCVLGKSGYLGLTKQRSTVGHWVLRTGSVNAHSVEVPSFFLKISTNTPPSHPTLIPNLYLHTSQTLCVRERHTHTHLLVTQLICTHSLSVYSLTPHRQSLSN